MDINPSETMSKTCSSSSSLGGILPSKLCLVTRGYHNRLTALFSDPLYELDAKNMEIHATHSFPVYCAVQYLISDMSQQRRDYK